MRLLEVQDLSIVYPGAAPVVDALCFAIDKGEAVGLVGESGSGKTQTALAIMGLLPRNAVATGRVQFEGTDLLGASERMLNRYRTRRIGIVFQDPMSALNPYLKIGDQLGRVLIEHGLAAEGRTATTVLDMLKRVGLPDVEKQAASYPHQLSGGMRQRAMIAAALIGNPDLLIADEPTTALDVTVQAQILGLMRELRRELGTALLLITHDLGVIAGNSDRMLVMQNGRLIEQGTTRQVFAEPRQPATRSMLVAARHADAPKPVVKPHGERPAVLSVENLDVSYAVRGGWRNPRRLDVVRQLSFELAAGETVALVGESGSGKTSLARAIVGLLPVRSGQLMLGGQRLATTLEARPKGLRRELQMVFQDPVGSLNPSMRVEDIIREPLTIHGGAASDAGEDIERMLDRVGLDRSLKDRFPHELSGGQAQRVAIARALIMKPRILICDEAVAALDGSVRREILDLLKSEQERTGLALIFISHDLATVRRISHRVLVMYLGRVCELADTEALFLRPKHPYTKALLDAVPIPDPAIGIVLSADPGEPPSMREPPSGCVFNPRCPYAILRCRDDSPRLESFERGLAACHRAAELDL